ncbi:MAG: membrane integrity-associated transporter subunit PqiC [Gammaproteobacteria bacterium]|nr:membrane integrity-associated transporter subunit PqiC [Gammaproteobacteria bacterium]
MHQPAAVKALLGSTAMGLAGLLVSSCAALPGFTHEPQTVYLLEWQDDFTPAVPVDIEPCGSLLIISPLAAPGYATTRMAYIEQDHRVDYFVAHRWADTPARMLRPLMTRALGESGLFGAVVESPAPIQAQLRLESEVLKLRQVFLDKTSDIELSLRVNLYDLTRGRLLVSRVLNVVTPAESRNPYGGVTASHSAVEQVFQQLADTLSAVLTENPPVCS